MLPLLLRRTHHHHHHHRHVIIRTLVDLSCITPVRDRALDHAVEKEHNLIPLISLKDLLKTSPSKSLPLSLIKSSLSNFPFRPIDFVRAHPAVFQEHLPAGVHPHVKLTPEILSLDEEELSVLNSETHLAESANRVLKLLMLADRCRIPLPVIEKLRFDLGLGSDFADTLLPNFPDYFRVDRGELELVCKHKDLAVSVIEERKRKGCESFEKGMAVEFPMKFSRGFEVEKKFKKWVDEWQKLPYISPYENAMHLSGKNDEGDKWVVAVLHEVMSLLYSKKTDRENLLFFGEVLGLRTRFKQSLLHHPGIFYISRKIGSHTVVLRDGYKRDLLVEKHRLMDIRYKYIHLMNVEKEDKKEKVVSGDSVKVKKPASDKRGEDEENVDGEDEEENEISGSEIDDDSEDAVDDEGEDAVDDKDEDDEEDGIDENDNKAMSHKRSRGGRGTARGSRRFEGKLALKTSVENRFDGSNQNKTRNYEDKDANAGGRFSRDNFRGSGGRNRENSRFEGKRAEFGRDRSTQRRSRNFDDNNDNKRRKFSGNTSRHNRDGKSADPRSEGKKVEFGRDRSNQRRSRDYDDNNDNSRGRKSANPRYEGKGVDFGRDRSTQRAPNYEDRGDRGRTRDNSRFEGKRDFKTSNENGREGSYQRRPRNYEAKNEDGDRTSSDRYNRGRTRDNNPKFEGKRDFKPEGFNGKRNDRGSSKGSRYNENSRSGMEASA